MNNPPAIRILKRQSLRVALWLVIGVTGFLSQPTEASVIFQEGFQYANGFLEDVSAGGNAWSVAVADEYDVQSHTWGSWTGYSTLANKAAGPFNGNSGTGNNAWASLDSSINTQVAGTYYFSFTMQADANAAGWMNIMLRTAGANFTNIDVNNAFLQYNGGSKDFPGGSSNFGAIIDDNYDGRDLLVIGRIDFSSVADEDTGYLSIFETGESTETLFSNEGNSGADYGFQATSSATISGTLTDFGLRLNDDSFIGNIRVGQTLAEIGAFAIPEPSSILLVVYGILVLMCFRKAIIRN